MYFGVRTFFALTLISVLCLNASTGVIAEAFLAGITAEINIVIKLKITMPTIVQNGTTALNSMLESSMPISMPVSIILLPTSLRVMPIPIIPPTMPSGIPIMPRNAPSK